MKHVYEDLAPSALCIKNLGKKLILNCNETFSER